MKPEKNRTGPKLLITICVFFLLGGVIWIVAEIANANVPLKVEISPVENTYSFARHGRAQESMDTYDTNAFLVRFRVSNPSSTPYRIGIWSCTYFFQWGTDNTNVYILGWGSHKNVVGGMTLDSTNVYSRELPIIVRTNTKPGQMSFRMCFTPVKREDCDFPDREPEGNWAEGQYWSNEITITVVP